MKRILAILLAMVMVLSLAACGSSAASSNAEASKSEAADEAPEASDTSEAEASDEADETADAPKISGKESAPANDIVGTYKLIDMAEDGTSSEELEQLEAHGLFCLLVLNEDGTGEISLFGEAEELTWDETTISVDGEPAHYTFEDDVVVIAEDNNSMTFQKITEEEYLELQEKMNNLADLFSDTEDSVNPISPTTGGAVEVPENVSTEPVSGDLGDVHVDILSAEAFKDGEGNDAVRFYYDMTNTSEEPTCAAAELDVTASQEGYELVGTWALEDVPEFYNDILDVRPGITIRCIAEFKYKPDGGPLVFTVTDFWNEESLNMQFDPANLPGRPADDLTITPITEPDWMDGLAPEGDIEDYHVKVKEVTGIEDYRGDPATMIYFDFTNNSDSSTSFLVAVDMHIMQDGIDLSPAITLDDIPELDNYTVDVAPGETITVARPYSLRTDSPVTVEFYDWLSGESLFGTVIPVGE